MHATLVGPLPRMASDGSVYSSSHEQHTCYGSERSPGDAPVEHALGVHDLSLLPHRCCHGIDKRDKVAVAWMMAAKGSNAYVGSRIVLLIMIRATGRPLYRLSAKRLAHRRPSLGNLEFGFDALAGAAFTQHYPSTSPGLEAGIVADNAPAVGPFSGQSLFVSPSSTSLRPCDPVSQARRGRTGDELWPLESAVWSEARGGGGLNLTRPFRPPLSWLLRSKPGTRSDSRRPPFASLS